MKELNLDETAAFEEVVADFAMTRIFSDKALAKEVTKKQPKLARIIRDVITWLKNTFGEVPAIDYAAKLWNDAYNDSVKAGKNGTETKNTTEGVDIKYSKGYYNNYFEALTLKQWGEFEKYLEQGVAKGSFINGINVYFTTEGTPKMLFFKYMPSKKVNIKVVDEYKNNGIVYDGISELKGLYYANLGNTDKKFSAKIVQLFQDGKLQRYDSGVRGYHGISNTEKRNTSDDGSRNTSGRERTDRERGNGEDIGIRGAVHNKGISNKADFDESAFSSPKKSVAGTEDILYSSFVDSNGDTLTEQQAEYFADSKVRDEDGNLLVVYHGTYADFTVFDMSKGRANMDIQGSFFSPWELDAQGYGPNVEAYYLNIKNPASEKQAYAALNRFKGQNNAGAKAREYLISQGYDGVNNSGEEYIAFYPEQIKRIDNKTPTSNPDIRYSTTGSEALLRGGDDITVQSPVEVTSDLVAVQRTTRQRARWRT